MRQLIPIVLVLLLAACSSVDCPLNNRVYTTYKLAGDVTTLSDSLTVSTTKRSGVDSVLLNHISAVDSFSVPMSYQGAEDVLYFHLTNSDSITVDLLDTVRVLKSDIPHFESVDCNPAFFHNINEVRYTRHAIDSIVIQNKNVSYDASKAHFLIYFKEK